MSAPTSNGSAAGELLPVERIGPAPAPLSPEPTPSYASGFDGMATQPFSKETCAVLAEPVDPEAVEIKPDGIVFLPGVFYRDRLTRAFGPGGWALAPRGPVRTRPAGNGGDMVIYHGALFALGRFVSEAVGQCVYWPKNGGMTFADAAEGAKTDAITRCCKDLGIARELWDPGWRAQWQSKYAVYGAAKNRRGEEIWQRKPHAPIPSIAGTPRPTAGTAVAAPTAARGPSDGTAPAAIGTATKESPDDGEAPSEMELDILDELVFGKLKWKKQFAADWLARNFQTNDPASLTKVQVAKARGLLEKLAGMV